MEWGKEGAQTLSDQIRQFAGQPINQAELASYGTLTAAEFVWSWARIDPTVIKAAAFSSSVPIHSGYDFAQYIHAHYDTLGAVAQEGFFNRLMGYVGEQQVADLLAHQGHMVQMAASSTQPVWDMLIDGHPVNVKTVQDIASIKAEALTHHGVTYLVPTDAHGHLLGNMHHVAGFHHNAVHSSLHEGIASAHGEHALHGLGMHLPLLTVGFSAYRNYQEMQRGKDAAVAIKHTVVESVGKGTDGVVGAKAGALAGSFLGPLGILAGGVLGAVGGGLLGGVVANHVKRKPLETAMARMESALHEYGASFADKLETVRGYLEAPLLRMRSSLGQIESNLIQRQSRLRWWIWPDFYTVLLEATAARGRQEIAKEQENVQRVVRVFEQTKQSKRFTEIGVIMANHPAISELVGDSPNELKTVRAARQKVFYERKQLDVAFVAPE